MPLTTFSTLELFPIRARKLTPEAFAPFGGVISADDQIKKVQVSLANYGTATKIHKVAPIINNYANCASGQPATANWNIFRCSAPKHLIRRSEGSKVYTAKVLERHPYSSQTFIPMGQDRSLISYIVIVAKTDEATPQKLPDPTTVQAFVCRGNQSITYGPGIWHAPMVVIDDTIDHIDFAVLIHENGVPEEDCEECYFDPGYEVEFDPVRLNL